MNIMKATTSGSEVVAARNTPPTDSSDNPQACIIESAVQLTSKASPTIKIAYTKNNQDAFLTET